MHDPWSDDGKEFVFESGTLDVIREGTTYSICLNNKHLETRLGCCRENNVVGLLYLHPEMRTKITLEGRVGKELKRFAFVVRKWDGEELALNFQRLHARACFCAAGQGRSP